jgi:hypothetical protein
MDSGVWSGTSTHFPVTLNTMIAGSEDDSKKAKDLDKVVHSKVSICQTLELSNVINAFTFEWVMWGKSKHSCDELRERVKNEQGNVGLVAALALTIWIANLTGIIGGLPGPQWIYYTTISAYWCAIILHLMAMLHSILLIFIALACTSDEIFADLLQRIGRWQLTPLYECVFGTIFGSVAVIAETYAYVSATAMAFIMGPIVALGYIGGFAYLFFIRSLKQLYIDNNLPLDLYKDVPNPVDVASNDKGAHQL